MVRSVVEVSMRDDNGLGCSYALVSKGHVSVIIILKDAECGMFDYGQLKEESFDGSYLLLKHYANDQDAYRDFLKLIGKMCKKKKDSKYFLGPKEEDNRMVSGDSGKWHKIREEERGIYEGRYQAFEEFVLVNRKKL